MTELETKYFNLEPVQENSALPDLDDAEETLSLCDLPLNSKDTGYWNDPSKEHHHQTASSSHDQDFFEFFSEDFNASGHCPNDSVVFFGKLIHHKGAAAEEEEEEEEALNQEEKEDDATEPRNESKKGYICPWKSKSFNKSRTSLSRQQQGIRGSKHTPDQGSDDNIGYGKSRQADRYEISMKKASILASPVKSSRLYMLAFGMGRHPTKMGLNDIKMRQSKRNQALGAPAKMFVSDDTQCGGCQMAKSSSGSAYRAKSLWGLLKVLAGRGYPTNTVVKASFSCIPV